MNTTNQEFENIGNKTFTKYIKTSSRNNNPKKIWNYLSKLDFKKKSAIHQTNSYLNEIS